MEALDGDGAEALLLVEVRTLEEVLGEGYVSPIMNINPGNYIEDTTYLSRFKTSWQTPEEKRRQQDATGKKIMISSMRTLKKVLKDVLDLAPAEAMVDATLNRLMNNSSIKLFNKLVHNFKVQECHCATLQCLGVGKELCQVELTAGRVVNVNKVLEDILMHAMDTYIPSFAIMPKITHSPFKTC
ncbi:hypothetical protein CY34DRAFT_109175 [Suillus luteus UH-Slu-Lm8-n1]|uniref:Uncharacterized protein n=1 Tax=Suillus luteus UH-Slu-Lm8-n1 TaxID=930992 RepID=A0A0D0ASN2_9AGAM|nr:hypothetical protein CY34DRAFT_109175 [Suillus luteus UH-Slu-Lm8-n1]